MLQCKNLAQRGQHAFTDHADRCFRIIVYSQGNFCEPGRSELTQMLNMSVDAVFVAGQAEAIDQLLGDFYRHAFNIAVTFAEGL